ATTTVTDTTAPEAPTLDEVTSDDKTVSGTSEPGSTVTVMFPDGTTATGTAEPGSTVTITFPDGKTADGKANAQGEYSIAIPENVKLTGGEELLVAAMDSNGNISDSVTTTVTDTTAPEAP